jgi:hypothetical protein
MRTGEKSEIAEEGGIIAFFERKKEKNNAKKGRIVMGFLELAREAYEKNRWAGTIKDTEQSESVIEQPIQQEAEESSPLTDQKARTAGFMVGISGELYFATLLERSEITTMIFINILIINVDGMERNL